MYIREKSSQMVVKISIVLLISTKKKRINFVISVSVPMYSRHKKNTIILKIN
jgi:hypothetical protein